MKFNSMTEYVNHLIEEDMKKWNMLWASIYAGPVLLH
jgi:hypothetical protein